MSVFRANQYKSLLLFAFLCGPLNKTREQWQIRDFPDERGRGEAQSLGQKNLLFGKILVKNCMKMKEIG